MPNLVGIGLSQVPTNSMLGGMAYQDPEHASIKDLDLKNLSQINSEIADTAVDVFVYDTRKDSDGGAWRKRTQHTSWYNETLGTTTRGTRKEFPAVAVIVATSSGVTIYDGDDPDLPMWMVFEDTVSDMINTHNVSPSSFSLSALNANVLIGSRNPSYGEANVINFISDNGVSYYSAHSGDYRGSISQRNDGLSQTINSNYGTLINSVVNDVAMTVLPNAPIDDTTGLPVPTIAVATNDGVSVIKDDGTVISTASSSGGYYIKKVDFTDDHGLNAHIDSNSGGNKALVYVDNINKLNGLSYGTYSNWDGVLYANRYAANVLTYRTLSQGSGFPISDFISMSGTDAAVGSNFTAGGLTLLAKNNEDPGQGMVAFVTSDYNSGYQHGDIKGAFLSDTDTTDAIEYVQNGYFNNDVSSWTIGTTGTTATLNANRLLITAPTSGASWGYVYQGITTEIGKTYKISLHYDRGNVDGRINVRNDSTNTVSGALFYADLGTGADGKTYFNTFTATATTTYILLYAKSTSGGTSAYDEVSVTLEKDRSANNNGLQVFGTVTKSAVATGAELVSYGPFTNSNYLKQPYNSDLNFGTGAFSIMFWIKSATHSAYSRIMNRVTDIANNRVEFYSDTGTNLVFYTRDNASATSVAVGNGTLILNQWHCVVATRESSGRMTIYIDGIKRSTVAGTSIRDLTSSTAEFIIGNGGDWDAGNPFPGQLSLIRISATVPSPEQIKKIYEDEKHLFQENAKATLYGSSDAVTALAHDDSTDSLHVGTSSGRSEFQGLCRINNTTEAVTTAISASNELVAEQ